MLRHSLRDEVFGGNATTSCDSSVSGRACGQMNQVLVLLLLIRKEQKAKRLHITASIACERTTERSAWAWRKAKWRDRIESLRDCGAISVLLMGIMCSAPSAKERIRNGQKKGEVRTGDA